MKTIYLTTRNLAPAIQFYQQQLNAVILSQSPRGAILNLTEQQLRLALNLPGELTSTPAAERQVLLTASLVDKMINQPHIFYRQFMAPRPADKHQLPVQLIDADGHHWQIYSQPAPATRQ
ncbi:hypothetical protein [Rheinheimera sp. NSM]|uniref:hypothetical protein n=1 Tax=Rheinheimera sp. NSM TaxID=3457884 RepID=UPI004036671D